MKNTKTIRIFLILIITILYCTACDKMTTPIVANGYIDDVNIHTFFTNGDINEGVLPSGIVLIQREKGLEIKSIIVYDKGNKLLAKYSEDQIIAIREKKKFEKEFWAVTERGLYLIPMEHTGFDKWKEYIKSNSPDLSK